MIAGEVVVDDRGGEEREGKGRGGVKGGRARDIFCLGEGNETSESIGANRNGEGGREAYRVRRGRRRSISRGCTCPACVACGGRWARVAPPLVESRAGRGVCQGSGSGGEAARVSVNPCRGCFVSGRAYPKASGGMRGSPEGDICPGLAWPGHGLILHARPGRRPMKLKQGRKSRSFCLALWPPRSCESSHPWMPGLPVVHPGPFPPLPVNQRRQWLTPLGRPRGRRAAVSGSRKEGRADAIGPDRLR